MNIIGNNVELLSDEIICFLKHRYDELKNNNNNITINDLKIISKDFGYNPTIEELHDIAGETGHNIDFIYLLVLMGRVKRQMIRTDYKKILLDAYEYLDTNKNGTIELQELMNCCENKIDRGEMIQIFDTIDTDHDGHITKKEFIDFLEQDFN